MRFFAAIALCSALLLPASRVDAKEHVVGDGQTLGKIAKRYQISIAELCQANGITRRTKIKPGQRLTIPEPGATQPASISTEVDEAPEPRKEPEARKDREDPDDRSVGGGLRQIDLPGAAPAYYFEPQ